MIKRRKKYSKNKEHNDYDYDSKEWNHLIREQTCLSQTQHGYHGSHHLRYTHSLIHYHKMFSNLSVLIDISLAVLYSHFNVNDIDCRESVLVIYSVDT